ncbi:hypothetical protein [Amycolatopsis plumensis]|uniref:Flagellar basal body-associated protein FliL n=1 Tax=Amycolatopsis plumensis TaxID=236508 RepID=A0ABV5UIX7_9PSEU
MSWQEELRRLDEELAAGQISADDYRVRRDGVLSAAVNADSQAAPATGGSAESTQIIAPVNPPQSAPTPAQQPGGASAADQTQIVNSSFGGGERTQAVGQGGAPQGWAPGAQPGDAERTQVVPGVPPQAVAGGYRPQGQGSGGFPAQQTPQYHPPQGQQQMPWNAPSQDTSTPWGASEFPADTNWVAQGPEPSFETTPAKGGKKVLAIVLAVVVLAGLGVGGYFLFSGNSDDKNPPVAQSSSAPPSPTQKPKDDLEIAKLPGNVLSTTDFGSFDELKAANVLTEGEYNALTDAQVSKARQSVSKLPSGATAVVLTLKTAGAANAANAVEQLTEQQVKFKLVKYTGSAPAGVEVMQLVKEDGTALVRVHYVHKQTVVRVHVDGPDLGTVSKVFDEILAKQLTELPVTG